MTPIQILTNNLLYDVSQTAIPTDAVDPEQIATPRPWDIGSIAKFILFIGPCSSVFDYTTFVIMLYVFNTWAVEKAALFQTGWFVESLLTQTLIVHVIRTKRVPFLQSRASGPLTAMTAVIMSIGVLIPTTSLGRYLGFTRLPPLYWFLLVLTLVAYMLLTQSVKAWLIRRAWI
jgi:P-type Mg2+ transporter